MPIRTFLDTRSLRAAAALALFGFTLAHNAAAQLTPESAEIDHAGVISEWDDEAFERGKTFFESSCAACHGMPGETPPHAQARVFGREVFRFGDDPYSMYRTLTFGAGAMLPQTWLAPAERYDAVYYIREAFVQPGGGVELFEITDDYLESLPKGLNKGQRSEVQPRDFGPVLTSQIERRVNLALTFDLGYGVKMSYDLQRMAVSNVWSGDLDLSETQHVLLRGEGQPEPAGEPIRPLEYWYWCNPGDLSAPPQLRHETWIDDSESSAWLPPGAMEFHGHHVHGRNAALAYSIRGREVLEVPGAVTTNDLPVLHHTIEIGPGNDTLILCAGRLFDPSWPIEGVFPLFGGELPAGGNSAHGAFAMVAAEAVDDRYGPFVAAAAIGETGDLSWSIDNQRLLLTVPPSTTPTRFRVYRASGTGDGHIESFTRLIGQAHDNGALGLPDLSALEDGGSRLWREELRTEIVHDDVQYHYEPVDYERRQRRTVTHEHVPYTVDTITLPWTNPWNAWMRMSDLAFFDDGTLAVSTLGGDVWLVTGLESGSTEATWKRFASGLFEPLGLEIIDGLIYAVCRGGIVRLHDLNGDGQADWYENFHADHEISNGFHAYNFDLIPHDDGNLYYIKPGRYTDYRRPGAVVRVSPDGGQYEITATGFRVPNGLGLAPGGVLLGTDNQGEWVPANKIQVLQPGHFYGVFSHEDKEREDYTRPLIWLPQEFDNSPGKLVHAADPRFGPLAGLMIGTSFGKGWVYYLLGEISADADQTAAVTLPFQFRSGVMRAAVNPRDGQVYVTGLTGWDTESTELEGCLQRIRYTGESGTMLIGARATRGGIELEFSGPIDTAALSPGNFEIERWNYRRTADYGSDHWSVDNPDREGHDTLRVAAASAGASANRVRLDIEDMRPADTLRVHFTLKSANQTTFRETVYLTVHRLAD